MRSLILYTCLLLALLGVSCEPISFSDWKMEPYTGTFAWEEVSAKAEWSNRIDHAAVAFNGRMWILGGYDSGRLRGDTYLEDIWSSANGREWRLESDDAPWKGRQGHTVNVFDDGSGEALYLIGGFRVDEETGYRNYTNDIWKSGDGKNWEQILDHSEAGENPQTFDPRFNHACVTAAHGGISYLYVIGGSAMMEGVEGVFSTVYFKDVWRSVNGLDWEKMDNTDFGQRTALRACTDAAGGRIYIHGGMYGVTFDNSDGLNQPVPFYNQVWYSDNGSDWYVDEEEFELRRAAHALVTYEESIWLLPGKLNVHNQHRYGPNQYIDDDDYWFSWRKQQGGSWELDSKGSAFSGRHSYATLEFDGKLWVLGGETADKGPDNDVWCGYLKEE